MHRFLRLSFILVLFVSQVLLELRMTVVYGEPENFNSSQTLVLSWNSCVSHCFNDSQCIVAYEKDAGTCQLFTVGTIGTVKRLSTGNRIAFKAFKASDTCPTDFEIFYVGYCFDGTTFRRYLMNYNDSAWSFDTGPAFTCPTNFTMFMRGVPVCMQVISYKGCFNYTHMTEKCRSVYGGIISGPVNDEEYNWLIAQSLPIWGLLPDVNYSVLGVWVDGVRLTDCYPPSPASWCNGTNEFSFRRNLMDTVTPNYVWLPGKPDGKTSLGDVKNCVVAQINNASSYGMVDVPCAIFNNTTTCFGPTLCAFGLNIDT